MMNAVPSNPSSVVPSANPQPPPGAVNILAPIAETGLTPAQRCAAANADMETCLGSKEQIIAKIAALEKQALIACAQCDQIRAQIAALRAQLATPVPAPRLTGPALRYGPTTHVGNPIIATGAPAVCEKLPALQSYATATGLVESANYTNKIKPLVDILSKNSRPTIKALRDTLKSYDPPGAFMKTFGRKAKAKSGLTTVAGSVSTAIGCPVPGGLRVEGPPSLPPVKPALPTEASVGNLALGDKSFYENATKTGGARRRTHRHSQKHRKATRKQKYHRR